VTVEKQYRVVENSGGKEKLWWRGEAPSASEAMRKAVEHIAKCGYQRRVGTLHVLLPGQRFDPKLGKAKHT